jgi:hypothetical protein
MTRSPTKHTPRPWRVKHNAKLGWAGVLTEKGDIIADLDVDGQDFRDPEQALADARLIAAAPDMLEALETLYRAVCIADADLRPGEELARAAIKKARGEE